MKQTFSRKNKKIHRILNVREATHETVINDIADMDLEAEAAWWQSLLRGEQPNSIDNPSPIRIVDAFCGSGGLALGMRSAIEAIGGTAEFSAIIDTDAAALEIHRHNLGAQRYISASAPSLVDFHVLGLGQEATFGYEPEIVHESLAKVGAIDLFIAGPPCQGHSNLNNHTRRQDPRNDLYITAVALGVALGAKMIVIENVPTVQNSHSAVVATAEGLLKSSGYGVSMAVLKADDLGAAQRRTRHFLIGVLGRSIEEDYLSKVAISLAAPAMPLSWAIGDLLDKDGRDVIDTAPTPTAINIARIDYLFDNDLFDLPDDQRPDCHKNGTTYTAVYGRMHWNRPTQTITTGFGTPGQGRYIHPLRRRVITPHEAARIQGFPDWFDFAPDQMCVKRKNLAKWIGDAVHPILGYAVGLSVLTALEEAAYSKFEDAA
ncbi:DNA (cytosine-5)-methyltransferase 1 [Phyllobacterium sp. CL33Tsu]|uniref:DNA cytosine methyltransferase n=1 Tax=Phyllobacterium sp. CL33Tsu TaxID=1798191 RepID=UPI0008EF4F72|nr:DNA cytosine methyltransferase [Phyllobacterium sp. CL33Tsu]SFJ14815.1 DNA (cytosine-5)-methyltransferase 1 [Phyllobacterium sp. CL33Tsu]